VRMRQDGIVVAVRRVTVPHIVDLNGIATSTDGKTIYVTFTGPTPAQGGVLAVPAF
jgi:sugar lactone lactonase YvrE